MRKVERLAILNGFGRSLGDSLVGLQALHALQGLGLLPKPVLFREDHGRTMVNQLYPLAIDFADVAVMPEAAGSQAILQDFDTVIDIRDFAFDPSFRGVSMIDYFLDRLGTDPAAIPAPLKRNLWLASRAQPLGARKLPARYVLFCPGSSMALRDMPETVQNRLLDLLRKLQTDPIVTQGQPYGSRVIASPSLSAIGDLFGLVAGATCIVSTDTAMVHLADAFSIPCLAFFTTHRAEWRMRDYPLCTAVCLPVAGLPAALEFCRGDDDLAAVARGWEAGEPALEGQLAQFLTEIRRKEQSPVQ